MQILIRAITAALLFGLSASAGFAQPSEIGRRAASGFITTGYERLVGEAALQSDLMGALCDDPGEARLDAARAQFGSLVRAWSRIEIIRFGPILADNRLDRMLFWPDRRGIALRQIQALIAQQDVEALDPATLRQKSIALQGLGSLEYVLFGTGADDLTASQTYRCALGAAIADAIDTTASEVLRAWEAPEGIAAHFANPVAANADYRSEDEVLRELLGVFVHGFELIRDVRLSPLIGTEQSPPNSKVAIYRRSELTIESMAANIAGMKDLFLVSGMDEALTDDMRWVAGALDFEFQNFADTAAAVADVPIAEAVVATDPKGKIKYLHILSQSLQKIAVDQIAVSLGLSAGFSSLDGD